jgi:hypothetical protein
MSCEVVVITITLLPVQCLSAHHLSSPNTAYGDSAWTDILQLHLSHLSVAHQSIPLHQNALKPHTHRVRSTHPPASLSTLSLSLVSSSPSYQSHLLADGPVVAPRLPRPHLKIEGPPGPEEDPPVEAERAYCVCIGVLARPVSGEVG